ncbi:MAG: hypothetical protein KAH20_11385 [Methylococcales bacterium]|nr:hypothetical protein [Methylococcales bacterium]
MKRLPFATAISVLIIGGISIGIFAVNKTNKSKITLTKNQPTEQVASSQMAYIDPTTGQLSRAPRQNSLPQSSAISENIDIVQVVHANGLVSVDTSHIKHYLQATVDCSGKLNISHSEKEFSTTAQQPCKEMKHVKN